MADSEQSHILSGSSWRAGLLRTVQTPAPVLGTTLIAGSHHGTLLIMHSRSGAKESLSEHHASPSSSQGNERWAWALETLQSGSTPPSKQQLRANSSTGTRCKARAVSQCRRVIGWEGRLSPEAVEEGRTMENGSGMFPEGSALELGYELNYFLKIEMVKS